MAKNFKFSSQKLNTSGEIPNIVVHQRGEKMRKQHCLQDLRAIWDLKATCSDSFSRNQVEGGTARCHWRCFCTAAIPRSWGPHLKRVAQWEWWAAYERLWVEFLLPPTVGKTVNHTIAQQFKATPVHLWQSCPCISANTIISGPQPRGLGAHCSGLWKQVAISKLPRCRRW